MYARIRTLPSAGLLLLVLLLSGVLDRLPDLVRIGAAVAALVWIPGVLILRAFGGGRFSPIARLPLAFFAGISAHALLASVALLSGNSFSFYSGLSHWVVALGLVFALFRAPAAPERAPANPWLRALWCVLALVALVQAGPFGFGEDAYDHIGYIRQIITEGRLLPDGVLAMPADADGALAFDPRKGAFHGLVALVASDSGTDPYRLWQLLPVFVFPMTVLAFLSFTAPFVGGLGLVVCLLLFLASYGGVGVLFPGESVYGQNLAIHWCWLATALVLSGRTSERRTLLLLALLAAGGIWVHAGVAVHLGVLCVTALLFSPWIGMTRSRALMVSIVVALAVLPGMLFRLINAGEANVLHTHAQGVLFITDRWFVLSPFEILRQYGLAFLGGVVLAPVVALMALRSVDARRELAFVVVPFAICFIPLLATPLFEKATYMAFRTLLNVPIYALIVTALGAAVVWGWSGGLLRKAVAAMALTAWCVAFLTPGLRAAGAELAGGPRTGDFVERHADLIAFLRTLPAETVIASDPQTAYALSALTSHRFVAINGQHANPFDPYAIDRLEAVEDILSPYAVTSAVASALDRYNVDLVVLNGASPLTAMDYLGLWDRRNAVVVASRLLDMRGTFRILRAFPVEGQDEVAVREGRPDPYASLVLLRDPGGDGESMQGAATLPFSDDRAGAPCAVESADGAWGIQWVRIEPGVVVPGGQIEVTVGYENHRPRGLTLPEVIHIRFDHGSIAEAASYPGAKHVRRFRERSGAGLMRFRHDHRPAYGAVPQRYWPVGRQFSETFTVPVPVWTRPGTYRVEFSIATLTMLPNFTLADMLYERDHYSGVACAEIEVSMRAVTP